VAVGGMVGLVIYTINMQMAIVVITIIMGDVVIKKK
jgi:hypothetical protein